jgi:hypothetical protein
LLLEAFLSAVISVLLSPGFTKIREEVVKKVKNRIRSQSSFGERALKRPISDFSEKDHEEIRNIVVTTIEEYSVSKEIKNTLAESYSTVLSTKSVHVIRIMNGVDEGTEYILELIGSSLFCMGNLLSPLSTEADYMRGVMNDERP